LIGIIIFAIAGDIKTLFNLYLCLKAAEADYKEQWIKEHTNKAMQY